MMKVYMDGTEKGSLSVPKSDISCPDFFKLGDKYMLMGISHSIGCRYYIGEFKDNKFYPEVHERMNWGGGACFAQESMIDHKGRRIMWAWAIDSRFKWENHEEIIEKVGWSGTMTLPRVLSLGEDGTLRIEPIEELKTLRSNHQALKNINIAANSELKVPGLQGDCFELDMAVAPGKAGEFGIKIRCSPNGEEETIISYDVNRKSIVIDVAKSTLDTSITYENYIFRDEGRQTITQQVAPFEIKPGEKVNFHIFADRSIVEVFVNDRICLTQRIYPTRDDSQGMVLFAKGGNVKIPELNAWKMQPANPW